MTRINYKRRNYFINKTFQGRLILGYFLFMVVGCLIFATILVFLSADSMILVYQENDPQMDDAPFILIKQVVTAHLIAIIVGGVFVVIAALFITHRTAGPMFHFERSLDKMIQGKLDHVIHLRKKDEGKELAKKLNQFNQELSENVRQIRKRSQNIDDLLTQYSALNSTNITPDDLESIYSSIFRQNQIIQEFAEAYQLTDE